MTKWTTKFALWLYYHPYVGLCTTLLVIITGSILGVKQITLSSDLIDLLPSQHQEVSRYKEAISDFNPLNRTLFALSGVPQEDLILTGDKFSNALENTGMFKQIRYQFSPDEVIESFAVLRSHRAALFTPDAQNAVAQTLTRERLESTLRAWKRNLIENPAPYLGQAFLDDPINLNAFLYDKLRDLQSFGDGLHTIRGRLFSSDSRSLLIIAFPDPTNPKVKNYHRFTKDIEKIVAKFESQWLDISWLASQRFASKNELQMRTDVSWATTVSFFGILILSILVFRRRVFPLIALSPFVFAVFISISIIPWFFDPIALVAVGVGSILLGLSIDYGLHVLFHLDSYDRIDHIVIAEVISKLTKPLTISAATTVVAFACLLYSDLPTYRQFGAIAAVGMAAAWFYTLILLPTLAAKISVPKSSVLAPIDKALVGTISLVQKRSGLAFTLISIATFLAVPGILKVKTDGDVSNLYLSDLLLKNDMNEVNRAFGNAMESLTFISKGENLDQALNASLILSNKLKDLKRTGIVESYTSVTPLISPREVQKENIKRWNLFWNEHRLQSLNEDLQGIGVQLGMRSDAFSRFIEGLSRKDHSILKLPSFQGTPLEDFLDSHINVASHAKVLANARLRSGVTSDEFIQYLRLDKEVAEVINPQGFVRGMIDLIFKELKVLAGLAIICVLTILIIFQGLSRGVMLSIPLFVSLVWTFGVMGWLGQQLNVMNCIIILLIFGLMVDYSVFLSTALQDTGQMISGKVTGAIAISALTTLLAVGALAMASHPALRAVGLTTLIGLSSGFTAVILVTPAIHTVFLRRSLRGGA